MKRGRDVLCAFAVFEVGYDHEPRGLEERLDC